MFSYHSKESFQEHCLNLIQSSSFSFLRNENLPSNVVFIKWFEIQLVILPPLYNTIFLMFLCKIKWQKSINITKLCLLHDLCLNVTNFITAKNKRKLTGVKKEEKITQKWEILFCIRIHSIIEVLGKKEHFTNYQIHMRQHMCKIGKSCVIHLIFFFFFFHFLLTL